MLRFYKLLALNLSVLFISACSLLPGMTFSNPGNTDQSQIDAQTDINPELIPITPQLITNMAKTAPPYEYHVGPGDHLAIIIWSQPTWSGPGGGTTIAASSPSLGSNLVQSGAGGSGGTGGSFSGSQASISSNSVSGGQVNDYLVDTHGKIFLPYFGKVFVAGQTEDQLQDQLTQLYKKYIRNPQITLRITTFASQQIYVLGEANQQALLALTDSPMSLALAIADAGGINPNTANPSQIFVIRGDFAHPTVYWLNSESPTGMLLAQGFVMQNHDVVFISPAAAVSWNRVLNQILPTLQAVWTTRSLLNSP
jgi:polysaccharide export outer membrane protein